MKKLGVTAHRTLIANIPIPGGGRTHGGRGGSGSKVVQELSRGATARHGNLGAQGRHAWGQMVGLGLAGQLRGTGGKKSSYWGGHEPVA